MNHRNVGRLRPPVLAAFAGATIALVVALDVSAAMSPAPITQRSTGKTFRIAKDGSARLRLSNRWLWSTPRASTRAVDLVPVEYFVDPGFREWLIKARVRGSVTIRSLGRPNCTDCDLTTRHFKVTIVVGGG